MAIRTGFFDAAVDEATGVYDRTYDSQDFVEYFENMIGSGVCVYQNGDSMRVTLSPAGDQAIVAAGYLFIKGYWLKNDEAYPVELVALANGIYAVCARLNLSRRAIELVCVPKATPETYADALVLGYVTITAPGVATVEDTRSNAAICGLIDAAGSLCEKVEYALRYIDTEIEGRLEQIERDMRVQEAAIDSKIEQAAQLVGKMAPPPIGSIKYSAAAAAEQGWIPCDGSFINETDYPELVAALGKNTPNVDEFQKISTDAIPHGVSNVLLHEGFLWVYSVISKVLYKIDPTLESVTEIPVTTPENRLEESSNLQICLSIVDSFIFLTQKAVSFSNIVIYQGDFSVSSASIVMVDKSSLNVIVPGIKDNTSLPYVYKAGNSFYMVAGRCVAYENVLVYIYYWKNSDATVQQYSPLIMKKSSEQESFGISPVHAFNAKNKGAFVYVSKWDTYETSVQSYPGGALSAELNMSTDEKLLSFGKCMAVHANGQVLNKVTIEQGNKIGVMFFSINPPEPYNGTRAYMISYPLPSMAQVFADSLDFVETHLLWMCFVGTGILFSRNPKDKTQWGYLDTAEVMGVIAKMGGIRYDNDKQLLYVYGLSSQNRFVLYKLKLKSWFDYANNGTFVPMIAADGVPAYIKAKEPT